jgi:two pore calcium channel protein 3
MFLKIATCIPIVLRISVTYFMIFYCYSILGVEVFTTLPPTKVNNSPYAPLNCEEMTRKMNLKEIEDFHNWGNCKYTDFNSILGAFLTLFQISIAASQHII